MMKKIGITVIMILAIILLIKLIIGSGGSIDPAKEIKENHKIALIGRDINYQASNSILAYGDAYDDFNTKHHNAIFSQKQFHLSYYEELIEKLS